MQRCVPSVAAMIAGGQACETVRTKDPVLKPSLSVFLPVWNRQDTVSSLVSHLLEVLPDLTPNFQLVLIDDGSHDATGEIARKLALLYPQVRLVAHPARWGRAASMRTGLLHSSSEFVLYRSEGCPLGLGCLPQLWQAVRTHDLVVARMAGYKPNFGESGDHSSGHGTATTVGTTSAATKEPEWQMIRRRALDAWRRHADDDDWLAYIVGHNYTCMELVMGEPARLAVWGQGPASWPRPRLVPQPLADVRRVVRKPNYISRIKAFAWGE